MCSVCFLCLALSNSPQKNSVMSDLQNDVKGVRLYLHTRCSEYLLFVDFCYETYESIMCQSMRNILYSLGICSKFKSTLIRRPQPFAGGARPRKSGFAAPLAAQQHVPALLAGPEKHQKSFRRVGERFLDGIRVAHQRLQEHSPPPF